MSEQDPRMDYPAGQDGQDEEEHTLAGEEEMLWQGRPHDVTGIKARTTEYRVTTQRVQIRHTGITAKVTDIDLRTVQDVTIHQSLRQRPFGVGDVIVAVSGPTAKVVLEDLEHYEQVRDIIRRAAREQQERRRVRRYEEVEM